MHKISTIITFFPLLFQKLRKYEKWCQKLKSKRMCSKTEFEKVSDILSKAGEMYVQKAQKV